MRAPVEVAEYRVLSAEGEPAYSFASWLSGVRPTKYIGRVLVLASQSPRRQEILRGAGIPFLVRPPLILEQRMDGEAALDYVRRLASEKASAVPAGAGEIVLGADTVVVAGESILEKPRDGDEARRMLQLLSGRDHDVITGICLRTAGHATIDTAVTRVRFATLDATEIDAYVASGEPMDKAGAYAIQGLASKFIDGIDGCYFNVVGLPVALVYRRLKELGFRP
jgi:septum formation protein